MRFSSRRGTDPPDLSVWSKARKRVRTISTYELLEWADAAGSGMSKCFMDYRKHENSESLEEISLALITLQAVTDELKARHDAASSS